MQKRIEYFGINPVRYLTDENGFEYVCLQDLREACDMDMIHCVGSDTVN